MPLRWAKVNNPIIHRIVSLSLIHISQWYGHWLIPGFKSMRIKLSVNYGKCMSPLSSQSTRFQPIDSLIQLSAVAAAVGLRKLSNGNGTGTGWIRCCWWGFRWGFSCPSGLKTMHAVATVVEVSEILRGPVELQCNFFYYYWSTQNRTNLSTTHSWVNSIETNTMRSTDRSTSPRFLVFLWRWFGPKSRNWLHSLFTAIPVCGGLEWTVPGPSLRI